MGGGRPNALGTHALCARDSGVLGGVDFSGWHRHSSVVETGQIGRSDPGSGGPSRHEQRSDD